MKNFNEQREEAWRFFISENGGSLPVMTIKEIFDMGYLCAWHDLDGEWEDGYAHGYDNGRYKSIEEGF